DRLIRDGLPGLLGEPGVDPRRFAVCDGIADDGVACARGRKHQPGFAKSLSLVKYQVRVMANTSVSRAIWGGKGANGAASATMRRAASLSILCSDGLSMSMPSTVPSLRMYTVMRKDPYTLPRAAAG